MDSASPFPRAAAILLKLDVLSLRLLSCGAFPPFDAESPAEVAVVLPFSDHRPEPVTKPGGGDAAVQVLLLSLLGMGEDMAVECVVSNLYEKDCKDSRFKRLGDYCCKIAMAISFSAPNDMYRGEASCFFFSVRLERKSAW